MAEEDPQKSESGDPVKCSEKTTETEDTPNEGLTEVAQQDSSNGGVTETKSENELKESSQIITATVAGETVEQATIASSEILSTQDSETKVSIKHEEMSLSEVTTTQMKTEISEFSEKHTTEMVSNFTQSSNQSMSEQTSSFSESSTSKVVETSSNIESSSVLDIETKIQGSPYYDSAIAHRISSEISAQENPSEAEKDLQKVVDSTEPSDSREPAEFVCNGQVEDEVTVTSTTDDAVSVQQSGLIEKESLRRLETEVITHGGRLLSSSEMNAVSPTQDVHVTDSVKEMFKVTKFEAKPFSEMKDVTFSNCIESNTLIESQTTDSFQSEEIQTQLECDMGIPPTNECRDVPHSLSPNAYKPADDMDLFEIPKKKKMFSSSSFYEEPNAIYPTVEEQVELCRKIADSLSDDTNKKSKGANMFFKRVKKAEKWIHESTGTGQDGNYSYSETSYSESTDPSSVPYVRVGKGPTQLKLILDPRHILDMKRLRQDGVNIVEHNAVSPEICLGLVKDLNSPSGRGALLFAKRKKKSEEWIVDAEKVNALLRSRESGYTSSPEPPNEISRASNTESFMQSRVQMIKTPWAAAMESPIGSCLGAFKNLNPNEVAESVIRAAETKVMTYPAPVRPVIEPGIHNESRVSQLQQNFQPSVGSTLSQPPGIKAPIASPFKTGIYTADPYRPRAPRGWSGVSSGSSQFTPMATIYQVAEPVQLQPEETPKREQMYIAPEVATATKLTHLPSVSRSYNFANFNASPKAWGSANTNEYQNLHIKPVKPPSVLVQ